MVFISLPLRRTVPVGARLILNTLMKKATLSRLGITLAGMLVLLLPDSVQAQAPQYTVTVLTGLGGSFGSQAFGINASGHSL